MWSYITSESSVKSKGETQCFTGCTKILWSHWQVNSNKICPILCLFFSFLILFDFILGCKEPFSVRSFADLLFWAGERTSWGLMFPWVHKGSALVLNCQYLFPLTTLYSDAHEVHSLLYNLEFGKSKKCLSIFAWLFRANNGNQNNYQVHRL